MKEDNVISSTNFDESLHFEKWSKSDPSLGDTKMDQTGITLTRSFLK